MLQKALKNCSDQSRCRLPRTLGCRCTLIRDESAPSLFCSCTIEVSQLTAKSLESSSDASGDSGDAPASRACLLLAGVTLGESSTDAPAADAAGATLDGVGQPFSSSDV